MSMQSTPEPTSVLLEAAAAAAAADTRRDENRFIYGAANNHQHCREPKPSAQYRTASEHRAEFRSQPEEPPLQAA